MIAKIKAITIKMIIIIAKAKILGIMIKAQVPKTPHPITIIIMTIIIMNMYLPDRLEYLRKHLGRKVHVIVQSSLVSDKRLAIHFLYRCVFVVLQCGINCVVCQNTKLYQDHRNYDTCLILVGPDNDNTPTYYLNLSCFSPPRTLSAIMDDYQYDVNKRR